MTKEQLAEQYATEAYPDFPAHRETVKAFFLAGWEERDKQSMWVKFADKMPEVGQQILILWPSGNIPPETREWEERMNGFNWSLMRWCPIPKYEPLAESPNPLE